MPLMPHDKRLHFTVGAAAAYAAAMVPLFFGSPPMAVVGFAAGYSLAILKELYDMSHAPHVVDVWDAAATKAGAALAAAFVEAGTQLLWSSA